MDRQEERGFSLGELTALPARNEITLGGRSEHVQPKVMAVFLYLAEQYPRVVSNDELLAEVWSGRVVTHSSVQKSINFLRKAIADLAGDEAYITHYSKKGYTLTKAPMFAQAGADALAPPLARPYARLRAALRAHRLGYTLAGVALCLLALMYLLLASDRIVWQRAHSVSLSQYQALTSEQGAEFGAAPHPNNRHFAYIRSEPEETVIRVAEHGSEPWPVASSEGDWQLLAWSPSGRYLAAVERVYLDERSRTPGFYGRGDGLYNLQVFELDLATGQTLDKHRLSQWQGHIRSLSWWSEDALELVASQGSGAISQRYRYHLGQQRLERVKELEFAQNPLASAIHDGRTALLNRQDGRVRVHFLNREQERFASELLATDRADISWLSDGSGVLLSSPDLPYWLVLYRDGERAVIQPPAPAGSVLQAPRYSADGQRIYASALSPRTTLRQQTPVTDTALTRGAHWNYAARWSPDAGALAYVSVRNGEHQIWLMQNGEERLLTKAPDADTVDELIWSGDGKALVFKAAGHLYRYALSSAERGVLLQEAATLTPVAEPVGGETLLVKKTIADEDNLWRVDLARAEQRQLTFGSVGAALADAQGRLYFQYIGQAGLWRITAADQEPELIEKALPANSELLHLGDEGVYFLTGGPCRESAIQFMAFSDAQVRGFLSRSQIGLETQSFHPEAGAVYRQCETPDSDILLLTD